MKEKYVLTDNIINVDGRILCQIRAVRDFGNVFGGDLGGYVESERNLSHRGNCWIYRDAMVFDQARVLEDALVAGKAKVYENAEVRRKARVYENTEVYGKAIITDHAEVSGTSTISGSARVGGYASVAINALVTGEARVEGFAKIFESAKVYGYASVSGHALLTDNASVFDSAAVQGYATIRDNATVCGSAFIAGNVALRGSAIVANALLHGTERVDGDGHILDNKDFVSFNSVGSECGTLTAYRTRDGGVRVTRGCFRGSIDEFAKKVEERHGNTVYAKEYAILIDFMRLRFGRVIGE